jgi:vitamin B12 transporter
MCILSRNFSSRVLDSILEATVGGGGRMSYKSIAGAAWLCTASLPVSSSFAQTALEPVVVTATRTETRADALVSDVEVIDRERIERSAARSLPEILAHSAGVQFSSSGGLGKVSGVFIRGTESRHTLLLIDGIPVGSATLGTPSWESIPLESIERIEVLKGPASALYGSQGVGGVVQIFTRSPRAGLRASAAGTAGARGFRELSASVLGGTAELRYAFGLQHTEEKGFSATNINVPFNQFNPDRDGYEQNSVNASLNWRLMPGWSLDARLLGSKGKSQFDDGPDDAVTGARIDARGTLGTMVGSIGVAGTLSDIWKSRLTWSQSRDRSGQQVTASPFIDVPSRFDTTQSQLSWQNDVATMLGTFVVGLENLTQEVDSTTSYDLKERSIRSLFAGLNGSAAQHSWQINVRHDKNLQFGSSDTGFAGYGFAITPQWRASASYGTSFVAPSFNQLYFPGFGNPLLQPERGRNTDVGVTYSNAGHTAKLTRFDNRIRGFITSTTQPANIPRAQIEGWTLSYDARIGAFSLRASYDALDPRNRLTEKILPLRSKEQTALAVDYAGAGWNVGASVLAVGKRFADAGNTSAVSGYSTLDLRADHLIARDWTLGLKMNNVTDEKYQTDLGYNQPGRGIFVTLRYQPK